MTKLKLYRAAQINLATITKRFFDSYSCLEFFFISDFMYLINDYY